MARDENQRQAGLGVCGVSCATLGHFDFLMGNHGGFQVKDIQDETHPHSERMVMVGVSKAAERGTKEGGNQFSDLHASDGVLDGGREGGVAAENWEDRDIWFGPLGGTFRGWDWKKLGRGSSGKGDMGVLSVDTVSPKRP